MKYFLIIFGFVIFINTFSQEKEKANFDNDISYKKIIKLGKKELIQTYKYKERRRVSTYYEYSDSISKEYKIKENSEIIKIAENTNEYYCLLRNDSTIELLKASKDSLNWFSIYKIYDNKDDYDLIVSNEKIIIISNTKIYHNLRNRTDFIISNISKLNCGKNQIGRTIFSNSSFCFYSETENRLYIGNDYGEWGGNLLKLKYNVRTNRFSCKEILKDNVIKIISINDCIYVLSLIQHMTSLSNTLYVIENNKVNEIFSLNGYDDKFKCVIDLKNWNSTFSNMPILNIEKNDNELLLLVHKKGIYKYSEKNNLELLKELIIDKWYTIDFNGVHGLIVDQARDFQIINETIYVIHDIPIVTKIKLK